MRRPRSLGWLGWFGLVILALTLAPGRAAADGEAPGPWYYDWDCKMPCELSKDRGTEGPFATYQDCDRARWADPRQKTHDMYLCHRPTCAGPIGWGGTLPPCETGGAPAVASSSSAATAAGPTRPARIASIELGVAASTGWTATGGDGMPTRGPATLGLEIETHTGKDSLGGTLMLGLQSTWLRSPMLGEDARAVVLLPLFVGVALTPRVYGRGAWSVRPDLGASIGGYLVTGCGDCPGAVFQETIGFGYTLKAGLDVYTSKDAGFSVEAVFPRWSFGTAAPGDLRLDSPTFLIRVALIGRPANP